MLVSEANRIVREDESGSMPRPIGNIPDSTDAVHFVHRILRVLPFWRLPN